VFTGNAKTSIVKSGLINGGRAGSEFINIIIKDRELSRLAELWVYGVEVDWRLLYKDCAVYRIPLPVYPFNKERYWAFEKLATVNIRGTVRRVSPLRIKQRDNVRKTAAVNENMLERVMEDLRNAAAAVLKVNPDKLDLDENLGNFGFESITLKELADNLSSIFSTEVSPALFFSHNSIKALGTYLIKEYGEKLRNYYSKQVSEEIADFTETSTETDFTYWHQNTYSSDDDSIAVVGMSGRFRVHRILKVFGSILKGKPI
jgi:polyketide synthase PksN